MPESVPAGRVPKLGLLAVCLLSACALLAVSLWTYDPADPPGTLLHPPREEVSNACGRIGAFVAHHLYASVGLGTFYLMLSLATVAVLLLRRRAIDQPAIRGVGWALSLASLATLAHMALPGYSPGPEIGAGGYLGAMGEALLTSQFATAGALILAMSVLLAGLLLSTDYAVFRFAAATTAVSGRGLLAVSGVKAKRRPVDDRPETDLEDEDFGEEEAEAEDGEEEYEYEYEEEAEGDEEWEEDEEEEPEPLTIKTPASKQEEAAEEAAQPEGEPTEQAEGQGGGLKNRLANALRIKNNRATPEGGKKAEPPSERDEIITQLEHADSQPAPELDYELPPLNLLLEPDDVSYEEHEKEVRRKARLLEKTFGNFGFNVKVVEIETGPVIAQYEVALEAGLRLSKIMGLADDLAIALRVPSVRIVAPIPGKNTVGIEVPNENRQLVRLREVIEETNGRAKRMKIPVYLGKDVSGNPLVVDLTSLPHLLIAGRTGTGKSVCLNSIIVSMLMSRGPDEVRMLMIDPKMVELSGYRKLPHLMHPVVTDMRKAEAILAWAVDKMEERYKLLARAGVRHVTVYNQLSEEELRERIDPVDEEEWKQIPKSLPFIVIVADEMADLMMTAGKEVEQHIIRLAQKSRAVGIHLILATQKPTVDVITGLIKSNLPARIAFQVASRTDSRVVLDEMGADKLLGNGDMLFLSPGTSSLLRGQGTFLSDDEITRVVDFVGTDAPQFAQELIELKTKDDEESEGPGPLKNRDELYEAAVDVVVRERRGSVSLLQRCLGIGYGRAARLIDFMAEDGIVGEYNGSQAREVMISVADWEEMSGNGPPAETEDAAAVTAATVQPKERRAVKIVPGSDEPSDIEVADGAQQTSDAVIEAGAVSEATVAPWEEGAEEVSAANVPEKEPEEAEEIESEVDEAQAEGDDDWEAEDDEAEEESLAWDDAQDEEWDYEDPDSDEAEAEVDEEEEAEEEVAEGDEEEAAEYEYEDEEGEEAEGDEYEYEEEEYEEEEAGA
ncbi:MAG: DNA translocase FtsK [Planctomycetota bacterium]